MFRLPTLLKNAREREREPLGVRGDAAKELDQYFTNDKTALECVSSLTSVLHAFDYIVEPSSGSGAFVRALQSACGPAIDSRLIFMDIDAADETKRVDYLSSHTLIPTQNPNIITIGNPPFGNRNDKALAFFNKAATYSAVVAFILPRSFRKESLLNKMDRRFFLVQERILDKDCFLFKGSVYNVPCVWQVWVRNIDSERLFGQPREANSLRSLRKAVTSVADFTFVKRSSRRFDVVIQRVGQRSGRIITELEPILAKPDDAEAGNFYYLCITDANKRQVVIDRLLSLDLEKDETKFDTASSHYSISKGRICERYLENQ